MKLSVIVCLLALNAGAQPTVTVTTNRLLAAPQFREVAGQLYNVERSVKWRQFQGPFDLFASPFPDLVLIQPFSVKLEKHLTGGMVVIPATPVNSLSRVGLAGGGGGSPGRVVPEWDFKEEKIPGEPLFVRNFQFAAQSTTNHQFRAMQVGVQNHEGRMIEVYDCGLPHYATMLTTNKTEAAKPK